MLKTLFEGKPDDIRQMTKEEGGTLLQCIMLDREGVFAEGTASEIAAKLASDPVPVPTGLKMLLGRLNVYSPDLKFSAPTLIYLSGVSHRPGTITLWAHTLIVETKKFGKAITITNLCEKFLPWGLPTEDFLHRSWDAQKGDALGKECDNYLDQTEAYVDAA